MLRRVDLIRTDVSAEFSASIITVTGISGLGTLAVISNRRTQRANLTRATRRNIPEGGIPNFIFLMIRLLKYVTFS
jgi:hypothetical protein